MLTRSLLNEAKNVKNPTKCLIFGYVERIETSHHLCICSMVRYMILLYFHETEYFHKSTKEILISNNKLTIIKNPISSPTYKNITYCNNWIESLSNTITPWTFRINKFKDDERNWSEAFIGIVSNDDFKNVDFTQQSKNVTNHFYAFSNNGCWFKTTASISKHAYDKNLDVEDVEFHTNDIIKITLNLKVQKIMLCVNNDEQQNILWSNIKINVYKI